MSKNKKNKFKSKLNKQLQNLNVDQKKIVKKKSTIEQTGKNDKQTSTESIEQRKEIIKIFLVSLALLTLLAITYFLSLKTNYIANLTNYLSNLLHL